MRTCNRQEDGDEQREVESCGCLDAARRPATMKRAARLHLHLDLAGFQGGGVCVKMGLISSELAVRAPLIECLGYR